MDKLVIRGKNLLQGEVKISGAKNSALPILFSTLLTDKTIILKNIPNLRDINVAIELLRYLGKKIEFDSLNNCIISETNNIKILASYELVKQMRASALVMGPLVARFGEAEVSLPGGCAIGSRPINIHLEGFKCFGIDIKLEQGYIKLKLDKKLEASVINLDFPSVGATENLIMIGVLASGKTIIKNAAKEPEIVDLCNFLNSLGAKISGISTSEIHIVGIKISDFISNKYKIIPDRIEAGTFLIIGALLGKEIVIKNINLEHLYFIINKMLLAGINIKIGKDYLVIYKSDNIKPINIETLPYPGFPTDMQAQWTIFMTQAKGDSIVTENIFEKRFMHIPELERMGARFIIKDKNVFIKGPLELKGAEVMATDLRASAALVIAGLIASGETIISRIYHLDRGYEFIEKKLLILGADIKRIKG